MKKVDNLLEPALALAKEYLQTKKDSGIIDEKIKSDISSFGTAIQQCGLLPAVAMYSNTSTESGKRGVKMLNIIFALLEKESDGKALSIDRQKDIIAKSIRAINGKIEIDQLLLKKHVAETDYAKLNILRKETMQACIALKLAVRTFDLQEVSDEKS